MAKLSVNIDHIATLREARKGREPDPIHAAVLAELGGACGITVHLREDRRHIQDRDVELLKKTIAGSLNLEMAATSEMLAIAQNLLPHSVCLVPEKRQELTTEGGLDAKSQVPALIPFISALKSKEIVVSLFIDADIDQVEAAAKAGAQAVEFHTGPFCHAYDHTRDQNIWKKEYERLIKSIELAKSNKLMVNLGHGINYLNIEALRNIPHISHYSIGHSIVARASLVGMERAVREMAEKIGEF